MGSVDRLLLRSKTHQKAPAQQFESVVKTRQCACRHCVRRHTFIELTIDMPSWAEGSWRIALMPSQEPAIDFHHTLLRDTRNTKPTLSPQLPLLTVQGMIKARSRGRGALCTTEIRSTSISAVPKLSRKAHSVCALAFFALVDWVSELSKHPQVAKTIEVSADFCPLLALRCSDHFGFSNQSQNALMFCS